MRQIWSRGVLLAYLERFSPCGGRRWRGGCDGLREAREKAEAGQRGIWRSGSQYGLVASRLAAGRAEEDSVEPRDFTDDQHKAMLRAIHEREGRWDRVDPDTEIAAIGEGIGAKINPTSCSGISWTKASSIRVVLIGQGARCRVAPVGSSAAKRT